MKDLTASQRTFLQFHVKRMVEKWRWHFGNTQLRAQAGKHTATIWSCELDDLIARGLMFKGGGYADVHPTNEGRAAV